MGSSRYVDECLDWHLEYLLATYIHIALTYYPSFVEDEGDGYVCCGGRSTFAVEPDDRRDEELPRRSKVQMDFSAGGRPPKCCGHTGWYRLPGVQRRVTRAFLQVFNFRIDDAGCT